MILTDQHLAGSRRLDSPNHLAGSDGGDGERAERGGEVADGGSGQAGFGERREEGDTDSPVDCTSATDVSEVTGLPNGRMLDIENGMFHATLLLIPFADGCPLVFVRHACISIGAAQYCCPSTRGIEAGRVGMCGRRQWRQGWVAGIGAGGTAAGMYAKVPMLASFCMTLHI